MYTIDSVDGLLSPSLILFSEALEANLAEMLRIAGDPSRLRPHCKTHKMTRVTEREVELGITKHKCATFAEAEMLAAAGAEDILLAYNPVGPNVARTIEFVQRWPDIKFHVTADHPDPIYALQSSARDAGVRVSVLLDLDTGMHRTGVLSLKKAYSLYGSIHNASHLIAGGLHVYDGQNHQTDVAERGRAVSKVWATTSFLRDQLAESDMPVPRIVVGGSGSFPLFAQFDDEAIELSPGTPVLYDAGYQTMFPDLEFQPAALVLTRIVSMPGDPNQQLLTIDAGTKAVAPDSPMERRLAFPGLSEVEIVAHNEEHMVIRTPDAQSFKPGDALLAVPWHICPTTALHEEAYVIREGKQSDTWRVTARHRR